LALHKLLERGKKQNTRTEMSENAKEAQKNTGNKAGIHKEV
jgi:hypothetical protein